MNKLKNIFILPAMALLASCSQVNSDSEVDYEDYVNLVGDIQASRSIDEKYHHWKGKLVLDRSVEMISISGKDQDDISWDCTRSQEVGRKDKAPNSVLFFAWKHSSFEEEDAGISFKAEECVKLGMAATIK